VHYYKSPGGHWHEFPTRHSTSSRAISSFAANDNDDDDESVESVGGACRMDPETNSATTTGRQERRTNTDGSASHSSNPEDGSINAGRTDLGTIDPAMNSATTTAHQESRTNTNGNDLLNSTTDRGTHAASSQLNSDTAHGTGVATSGRHSRSSSMNETHAADLNGSVNQNATQVTLGDLLLERQADTLHDWTTEYLPMKTANSKNIPDDMWSLHQVCGEEDSNPSWEWNEAKAAKVISTDPGSLANLDWKDICLKNEVWACKDTDGKFGVAMYEMYAFQESTDKVDELIMTALDLQEYRNLSLHDKIITIRWRKDCESLAERALASLVLITIVSAAEKNRVLHQHLRQQRQAFQKQGPSSFDFIPELSATKEGDNGTAGPLGLSAERLIELQAHLTERLTEDEMRFAALKLKEAIVETEVQTALCTLVPALVLLNCTLSGGGVELTDALVGSVELSQWKLEVLSFEGKMNFSDEQWRRLNADPECWQAQIWIDFGRGYPNGGPLAEKFLRKAISVKAAFEMQTKPTPFPKLFFDLHEATDKSMDPVANLFALSYLRSQRATESEGDFADMATMNRNRLLRIERQPSFDPEWPTNVYTSDDLERQQRLSKKV